MFFVKEFLKKNKVNKNLRMRIIKYIDYKWRDELFTKNADTRIFAHLSKDLRDDLLKDTYGKHLGSMKIITDNFSQEVKDKLIYKAQELSFSPGDTIYKALDISD